MKGLLIAACLLCAASAHAQIVSTHPPLSPEQAVAVLRGSHSIADRTDVVSVDASGPTVFVMRSSPTAGPYGEIRRPLAPRRLDGTLLSDPPWEQYAYVGPSYRTVRRDHLSRTAPTRRGRR